MERTLVAITGASSGIGEAFARKLAPGHDLLLIARRKDRLDKLADQLGEIFGTQIETLQADLTNGGDLEKVSERLTTDARLALLINNAGFGLKGRFWEADIEAQQQMHKLHVEATLRLTHAALRNMVPRDFGGIINVASVSSFVRSPGTTSYSATKAWMTAFTEGLYLELRTAHSNVTVQALCPGFTYSEFHERMGAERFRLAPRSMWLTAEEVVDASIEGIKRGRLFVVPNWRYKLICGIIPRLPLVLRTPIQAMGGRNRVKQIPVVTEPGQIEGKPESSL